MFDVRSARTLSPLEPSVGPCPCMPLAPPPPHALRLPARTSPRIVRPPSDSAASVGVQPAAELRHVQRHNHELHVPGALRACPAPPIPSRALACLLHAPQPPHALPALPASQLACRLLRKPLFRLGRAHPCPTQTRSSSGAHGRAAPSLTIGTVRIGAAWARARRRRHHRRHCRRLRRRHRPMPSRTRPPCGRRPKSTTPTRLPPLRRTAPYRAGASRQSQTCPISSIT